MNKVCINDRHVEKIEFVDATDNNKVLGTFNYNGTQECDNGYLFKITYKESVMKG